MSQKTLRWRIVHNSWDSSRAALLKTKYPERRHDTNGWVEWYEISFSAQGMNDDGGFNPNPDAWYAFYNNRGVHPQQTLYTGPSEEAAKAACNDHYNKKNDSQPVKQPTVKVVATPESVPVAGRIRLNVRHEAGLEGIQALIAVEKSLHGHNVHIDAIYEGEDEWYAYGMISYPDPAAPMANRDVPPRIIRLEGRRRSRRTRR